MTGFVCAGRDDNTVAEESLLTQLYKQIEAAGSQGMSQKVSILATLSSKEKTVVCV